jgi:hypothetical protein
MPSIPKDKKVLFTNAFYHFFITRMAFLFKNHPGGA